MADFQTALTWTLTQVPYCEDPQLEYKLVNDNKGMAISGINSVSFPDDVARIAALPQDQRGAAVTAFYQEHFWNQWLEQVASDDVAKRVFDAGVNMGSGTAAKLLQGAVNACGGSVDVDGGLGPITIAAVNECAPAELVEEFQIIRSAHYRTIAANNPADLPYLDAWLARAQA